MMFGGIGMGFVARYVGGVLILLELLEEIYGMEAEVWRG
jgi:hypothetical protein